VERDGYPFSPGAVALGRAAAAAGLLVGVVSGALRAEVLGALERAGLAGCCRAVVAAEDVTRPKPDPEGYRRGLALLAATVPPSEPPLAAREVLAVEDSPAGLAAARAAGLATLGVASTCAAGELATADAVADAVADLGVARLREVASRARRGPAGAAAGGYSAASASGSGAKTS
jgi:HAD superfamily hydrolase (TIGR01509 family)